MFLLKKNKSIIKVPDIVYFGSDKKLVELKNRVFLTPYKGIATLFIVNKEEIKSLSHCINFNLSYEEWFFPDNKLIDPLDKIHINHNVKEITIKETGESSGYIYCINVSTVKNKLTLFNTNDSNREVIYTGTEPLKVLEIIPPYSTMDL
jgi:GTPase Era involved in 16S rRNA processing